MADAAREIAEAILSAILRDDATSYADVLAIIAGALDRARAEALEEAATVVMARAIEQGRSSEDSERLGLPDAAGPYWHAYRQLKDAADAIRALRPAPKEGV